MSVAAWLLIILGAALIILGAYAVFKIRAAEGSEAKKSQEAESTEVSIVGITVKTQAPGIAMIVLGIGSIVLGTQVLPVSTLSVVSTSLATYDGNMPSVDYGDVLCPMSVELVGHISTSGGSGTVAYRFDKVEGVDGQTDQGAVQMVSFSSPGTVTVRDTTDVDIPEGTVYFREFLTIVSPGDAQSSPVSVTVTCDPTAPPPPPIPPPTISASSVP
jgi:heme/copper-type cytochrome/quinol oxidase subunit 2